MRQEVETRNHVIRGRITGVDIKDLKGVGLTVFAFVGAREVGRAAVDKSGRYEIAFAGGPMPRATELRVLPASLARHAAKLPTLARTVGESRYAQRKGEAWYEAAFDLVVPPAILQLWRTITTTYRIHGVAYAATYSGGALQSVAPMAGFRVDFYEVDQPAFWPIGTTPPQTESLLGTVYTDPTGSYDFSFDFSYTQSLLLILNLWQDRTPDLRARVLQFRDGAWQQIFENAVDWNITTDFHRDLFVPATDLLGVTDPGSKPLVGFRYLSLGLLPIDSTRFSGGYVTTQPGDPISGLSHRPFAGTLRIFGLFAAAPPVATYLVERAPADASGPLADPVTGTVSWVPVTDALSNLKWNDTLNRWEHQVLGPDPVTHRYQNIDTQPEADWLEHGLKLTWSSANVPDGFYVLRVTGYDAAGNPVGTPAEMPVLRVDNTPPTTSFTALGSDIGVVNHCGAMTLGATRKIRFQVTGYDGSGHALYVSLSGTRGKNAVSAGASMSQSAPAAGWTGVNGETWEFTAAALPADIADCPAVAYNFEWVVQGSATNGYASELSSQRVRLDSNLVVSG